LASGIATQTDNSGLCCHAIQLRRVCSARFSGKAQACTARALKRVMRDIDGVVIFMKAATSKNRSDSSIISKQKTRRVEDL